MAELKALSLTFLQIFLGATFDKQMTHPKYLKMSLTFFQIFLGTCMQRLINKRASERHTQNIWKKVKAHSLSLSNWVLMLKELRLKVETLPMIKSQNSSIHMHT